MARLTQQQLEDIARAVSDPRRFAILKQIAASSCVGCSDLHAQKAISPATISHHLKELELAGLITIERQGKFASMSLRRETWDAYVETLAKL
jgi:ArsR family transcriptional regulator